MPCQAACSCAWPAPKASRFSCHSLRTFSRSSLSVSSWPTRRWRSLSRPWILPKCSAKPSPPASLPTCAFRSCSACVRKAIMALSCSSRWSSWGLSLRSAAMPACTAAILASASACLAAICLFSSSTRWAMAWRSTGRRASTWAGSGSGQGTGPAVHQGLQGAVVIGPEGHVAPLVLALHVADLVVGLLQLAHLRVEVAQELVCLHRSPTPLLWPIHRRLARQMACSTDRHVVAPLAGQLHEVAHRIPVQRAGAAAQVRQVAALAGGRQELLAPPVLRRAGLPHLLEVLVQQAAQSLLEAGAGQHLAGGIDGEQPVGGAAGLGAQAVLRRVEQAVGHRRVPDEAHAPRLGVPLQPQHQLADGGVADLLFAIAPPAAGARRPVRMTMFMDRYCWPMSGQHVDETPPGGPGCGG